MGTDSFGWRSWADRAHKDSLRKSPTYKRCPYCNKKSLGSKAAKRHRTNCTYNFKAQLVVPEDFNLEIRAGDRLDITVFGPINSYSISRTYRIKRSRKQDNKIIYEIIK